MNNEKNEKLFVKIVNVDYYLAKPNSDLKDPCYSGFRSLPIYNVPVIRIFGPTSEGVKTCTHIHGVFPYIFIPNWNNEISEKDLYQFAFHLDKVINTSFANSSSKTSHVYRISRVSGRPFYGYCENERQFLKIEFYNPAIVKRATDLLQNGAVFNVSFQPHEAHVPYILQFFIDYNLYGMNYIILSSYHVRQRNANHRDKDSDVTNSNSYSVSKQSHCILEIDVSAYDIINPNKNSDNMPNNPGLAFIWEEEKKRKRLQNKNSQITPNISQNRPQRPLTRTELYFKTKLTEKLHALKINTSEDKLTDSFNARNTLFMNISQESELNSSYEEFNTQSRSILSLLEKLTNPNDTNEKRNSPCSSPSIVCSDDEIVDLPASAPISSQPLLKLPAENDSILGNNFSDNEIDDADDCDLSRSLIHVIQEQSFFDNDSDSESYSNIPQLDGANDISPIRTATRKKKGPNRGISKSDTQPKRTYNLRSKDKEANANAPTDENKKSRKTENRISPKKQYPQLQIDTQKSPKSSGIRLSAEQHQCITLTNMSPTSIFACGKTVATMDEHERLKSPSAIVFRNAPIDECRKSEMKRPYPQLEVIKKSPRMTEEPKPSKLITTTRIKKRKIMFVESESKSDHDDLFDVSSVTAKWKKQRIKLNSEKKNGQNSKTKESSDENSSLCYEDCINSNVLQKLVSNLVENVSESETICSNATSTVENDANSQKYSLKICVNTCDVDQQSLYKDLLLKKPVIRLQRISDSDVFKSVSDHFEDKLRLEDERCNVLTSENEGMCKTEDEPEFVSENLPSTENTNESFEAITENVDVRTIKENREDNPLKSRNIINKTNIFRSSRNNKNQLGSSEQKMFKDVTENRLNVTNVDNMKTELKSAQENHECPEIKHSLKRKRLGMRMNVRSKSNLCTNSTSTEYIPNDEKSDVKSSLSLDTVCEKSQDDSKIELKKEKMENLDVEESIVLTITETSSCTNLLNMEDIDFADAKTIILNNSSRITTDEVFPDLNSLNVKTELKKEKLTPSGDEDFTCTEKKINNKNELLLGGSLNSEFQNSSLRTADMLTVKCSSDDNTENEECVTQPNVHISSEKSNTTHEFKADNFSLHSPEPELFSFSLDSERPTIEYEKNTKLDNYPSAVTIICSGNNENDDLKFNVIMPDTNIGRIENEETVHCSTQNNQEKELFSQLVSNNNFQKNEKSENIECEINSNKYKSNNEDAVTVICSLNSEDDELFSNLNLDISMVQSTITSNVKDTSTAHSIINPTFENSADKECVECYLTNKEFIPNSEVLDKNVILETSPACLLEDDEKLPELTSEKISNNVKSCKQDFNFNNSIWDSTEDESIDDNEIKSFCVESPASVDITLFRNRETDQQNSSMSLKSPSENSNEIFEDTDSERSSSPIAQTLTPQSDDQGVMNFNDCESPVSSADFDSTSQNKIDASAVKKECSPCNVKNSISSTDDSPTSSRFAENVLHSTPQQKRILKKSPSPTFTPILKKLMLKKFSENDNKNRRRELWQKFQSEPLLTNIKEEEEHKCETKDTSIKLPMNLSNEGTDDIKIHNSSRSSSCSGASGQIDITLANTFGFQMNLENLQDGKTDIQYQFLTMMALEIFSETRQDLNPDPEFDPICCLFYSIFHDAPNTPKLVSGIIVVDSGSWNLDMAQFTCEKLFVENEKELFDNFIETVRKWDPDIFIGYEVEMLSWGYFIQRGQHLNRHCDIELSRIKDMKTNPHKEKSMFDDNDYSSEFKMVGRIVLNVWRLMRHEIALQSYTFENILFHVLHQRVPQHSFKSLTQWWKNSLRRWIVIDYYLLRTESNILLLQQLDFIGRTSELARLFGIQFYEVLSRGSQFRVESMMLRLAKTQNFVAVSPNTRQRAAMRAPESLPLIMEPESKFYTDPVIVLDFQSLYPSIIIAYNYCFSTCLGRMQYLGQSETFEFGCVQHTVSSDLLLKLESCLNFSPCGVAFVNKSVRTGILPLMLEEILETRLMVKKSMKENKNNKILQRVLHARQLGLKLIANVTYGYTAANFSGRMPCIEVGDSVVSKGRETLERAIELVSNTEKWGAKVIYGDTDSMFVVVPNRSKEEAFQIGAEIAEAVTNSNPKPVKLKLEKVYYPCILQTKKRYVGYMYENAEQKEPSYDAKGIETVRRDGCPAVSKILEKSLKLLFEKKNPDIVKRYVQRQFIKLMSGRLSIQELTFAREYRGIHNYKPTACVPALHLARLAIMKDRRAEPRVKERVRYIFIAGPPGLPLIRLVRTPQQFFENPGSIINTEYYITRVIIPTLERCFSLMNVNVQSWYTELPRKQKLHLPMENNFGNKTHKKKTLSHYFISSKCIACEELAVSSICKQCEKNPQHLAIVLGGMINSWQRKYNYISKICRSCCGRNNVTECTSLDCPNFYVHYQTLKDIEQVPYIEELQLKYLPRHFTNEVRTN